jgi:hypothetical protein
MAGDQSILGDRVRIDSIGLVTVFIFGSTRLGEHGAGPNKDLADTGESRR